jgi:hypothetical protein
MKLISSLATLLCSCALVLAACGDSDSSSGGSGTDPATVAPADSPLYFEFTSQPTGDQQDAIEALVKRFAPQAGLGDASTLDQVIQDAIDKSGSDVSYKDDIQSWLGDRAGFAITDVPAGEDDPPVAFAIQVTDEDKANNFFEEQASNEGKKIEKVEIDGVEGSRVSGQQGAYVIEDGLLIAGTTDKAFSDALAAHDGDSLADNSEFTSAIDKLPSDNLGSAYIDFGPILEQQPGVDQAQLDAVNKVYGGLFEKPIVLSLQATPDTIAIDASFASSEELASYAPTPIENVPSDAVAAFSFGDVGKQVETGIKQFEQLAEIGGAGSDEIPSQAEIDRVVEKSTGLTLSEIEDKLGNGEGYVRGSFPSNYVIGLDVAVDGGTTGLADKLRAALANQDLHGAKIGPAINGDDGFSVTTPSSGDPTEVRYIDVEVGSDNLTVLLSPTKGPLSQPGSGSLSDSEAFKSATDGLGGDYAPAFFLDLGKVFDAVGASSAGSDPSTLAVLTILKDQLAYVAAGSGTGSHAGDTRFVVGLTPDEG